MKKKVLITGVGGDVAQGIIRNILSLKYDIIIIGTETEKVSLGNFMCDKVYEVPVCGQEEYIPAIIRICNKENVDLIIPSNDYEAYYLSLEDEKLPELSTSNSTTAKIFLNKYETFLSFRKFDIPFAETILPSFYNSDYEEIIVKPVEGRGSRDIYINPGNPKKFSDEFIIQKYYKGTEISTTFYVTKERKLLGSITFISRKCRSGYTDKAEVTFKYDKYIKKILDKITKKFEIKGSCNMQSIVDKNNSVVPFEVNARMSGSNAFRSQFGFEDVRYTIEEYLFNMELKKPVIRKGSATRVLMSIIYPEVKLNQIKNKLVNHHIF